MSTDVDTDRLRMLLSQAYNRSISYEARDAIHAALLELDADVGEPLAECPVCGRVGLRERIAAHGCRPVGPRRA